MVIGVECSVTNGDRAFMRRRPITSTGSEPTAEEYQFQCVCEREGVTDSGFCEINYWRCPKTVS